MDTVTLRTARLELSPPREGDADAIFEACQDERLQRYTTVPSPYTREHAEGFIEKSRGWWESGSEATWAIRDGDTLVGMIGLHRLGDGISQSELAAAIGIDGSTLVRLLDMLVEQDLIERQPHPHDGRATGLQLTPQGEVLVRHAEATAAELELEATGRLTAAERKTLMRLLQKIYR